MMNSKVFITGVSSGIGLALAKKYLEDGAVVFGISRRCPQALMKHVNFHFQSVDLNNVHKIRQAVEQLPLRNADLEVVILSAGVYGPIGDLGETELADFNQVMNVNVWANKILLDGLFTLCERIKQVVALSSYAGIRAHRGSPSYCISKTSLNMLIALYAEEKQGTHFSTIAPPLVETAMQDYLASIPSDDRFISLELLKCAKAMGKMLSPDIAAELLTQSFRSALQQPTGSFVPEYAGK